MKQSYDSHPPTAAYLVYSGRDDVLTGGVKLIPVRTPKGNFRVWTKRVGNNPAIKLLLLHGGPGCTHEYFEAFDSYFPAAGIEYYYYDQLGSAYSDQPDEPELWELPRFVEEVEQVRQALALDRNNFYLLGHSWGGILGMEYALRYQKHLKALIISNMMASIPAYNEYASKVLMPAMDQTALAEIKRLESAGDIQNPRYMELLIPHLKMIGFGSECAPAIPHTFYKRYLSPISDEIMAFDTQFRMPTFSCEARREDHWHASEDRL